MAEIDHTETEDDFAERDDFLTTRTHSIVRFTFEDSSELVTSMAEELTLSQLEEVEEEEKGKEEEEDKDKKVILFFNVPLHGHVNPTLDLGFFFFPLFPWFSFSYLSLPPVAALVKANYRVIYYAEQKFKVLFLLLFPSLPFHITPLTFFPSFLIGFGLCD